MPDNNVKRYGFIWIATLMVQWCSRAVWKEVNSKIVISQYYRQPAVFLSRNKTYKLVYCRSAGLSTAPAFFRKRLYSQAISYSETGNTRTMSPVHSKEEAVTFHQDISLNKTNDNALLHFTAIFSATAVYDIIYV